MKILAIFFHKMPHNIIFLFSEKWICDVFNNLNFLELKWWSLGQINKLTQNDMYFVDVVAFFWETESYIPDCSFELLNHSSGVTCEYFSWAKDQSSVECFCEHLLLCTKACAVRPNLCVADLQYPSRLRREPTQPQQTHCWTTSNTEFSSELHYLTWKTKI